MVRTNWPIVASMGKMWGNLEVELKRKSAANQQIAALCFRYETFCLYSKSTQTRARTGMGCPTGV